MHDGIPEGPETQEAQSEFRVNGAPRQGRLIIGFHKVLKNALPLTISVVHPCGMASFLAIGLLKDFGEKTLRADFLDAHQRHLDDAESLFQAGRLANADHLYGMASECGLKRLMAAFGMTIDSTTGSPADSVDRRHVDLIWMRFESYRGVHRQDAEYLLASPSPFDDWRAEQRYAHQGHFNASRVEPHRNAAQDVFALIKRAQREGLI